LWVIAADASDVEAAHGLGAQEVIDHRAVRFEDVVSGVDAVIDLVGGEIQARSCAVLRRGGILVSAVSMPDREVATRHGVRALFFLVDVTTAHLTQIAAMIDAGDLTVNVGAVLPLADARVAHEMLEGSRSRPRGKIVLSVGE
jgi:NADPH:quinone reductase-like Zn-dependent oxidoreductase